MPLVPYQKKIAMITTNSEPQPSNSCHGSPHPIFQTITATAVARIDASITAEGMRVPIIAILVNVAKIPLAGVNPPYMKDWKAAAREPIQRVRLQKPLYTPNERNAHMTNLQQSLQARNQGRV